MKLFISLLSPYRGLPREVYIIFVARIINALGCFVMPMLTLIMTNKIGLSSQVAGLYISISGFLFIPASMVGGKLADTIGRKKVIILFDCLAIIFYVICGFMEPSIQMIYMLMLAGACMGTAGPAHDSLMADLTTPENRSSAYALSYMGWNIGFAVGPSIGGFLLEKNLPLVFWGDALTAFISLMLILFCIKETIHLTKVDITDKSRKLEKREEGSIFSVLSKRPILIYFALIVFWYNFAYAQWSFMMPMHSTQNFGESGSHLFGLMASFNGLIVMFFTPLITKVTEKVNNIRRMLYGGLLYAFGFGMLGVLNTLEFFFVSVLVFTIGEIVLTISTIPFIVNRTPASHRGRMSAVLPMIMGIGHIIGPAGMGTLIKYIGMEASWLILGVVVLGASLFMLKLEKYDKNIRLQEEEIDRIEAANQAHTQI